jgi:hypothetical protein
MQTTRVAPSTKIKLFALVAVVSASMAMIGCRGEQQPATQAETVSAPAPQTRSKEQAMAALMALPELKAWSSRIEKSSGGKAHAALIEYDPSLKLIDGKRYYQLSFVENRADVAQSWESFLVAESGDGILVEDAATDKTMTLAQWRAAKQPMTRTSAE